jgi:hypothetical protein
MWFLAGAAAGCIIQGVATGRRHAKANHFASVGTGLNQIVEPAHEIVIVLPAQGHPIDNEWKRHRHLDWRACCLLASYWQEAA